MAEVVTNVFRAATVGDTPPADAAPPTPADQKKGARKPSWVGWSKHRMLNTLRLANCCNGVCLVTIAIISFLVPVATLSPSVDTITLSAYTGWVPPRCVLGRAGRRMRQRVWA